jgi:hypothetical protein
VLPSNIILVGPSNCFYVYYLIDGVEEKFCTACDTRHFVDLEAFLEEVKDDPQVFVLDFHWEQNPIPEDYMRPILSVRYAVIRCRYRGADGGSYLRCR